VIAAALLRQTLSRMSHLIPREITRKKETSQQTKRLTKPLSIF